VSSATDIDIESLKQLSKELRVKIIEILLEAGSGHPGGSLSEIDLLVCLYFGGVMRYRADDPTWPERDRFLLSKGHCTPGYYATLSRAGFFADDLLSTFRKLGSPLQGHPDRTRLAGVELSAGSLGQGLSAGVGMALGARLDGSDSHVFVLQGDGETQEGQVWEAIAFAGNNHVDNVTLIIDNNQVQQTGLVREIADIAPLGDKLRAFKWNVIEIDGHDHRQCLDALFAARAHTGEPTAIIANTIKGKGVSWMELDYNWHGKAPNAEQAQRAIAEILGAN
jgi:transketolase